MEVRTEAVSSSLATRASALETDINPFWAPLAMFLTQDVALHYLRDRTVLGAENLPNKVLFFWRRPIEPGGMR